MPSQLVPLRRDSWVKVASPELMCNTPPCQNSTQFMLTGLKSSCFFPMFTKLINSATSMIQRSQMPRGSSKSLLIPKHCMTAWANAVTGSTSLVFCCWICATNQKVISNRHLLWKMCGKTCVNRIWTILQTYAWARCSQWLCCLCLSI